MPIRSPAAVLAVVAGECQGAAHPSTCDSCVAVDGADAWKGDDGVADVLAVDGSEAMPNTSSSSWLNSWVGSGGTPPPRDDILRLCCCATRVISRSLGTIEKDACVDVPLQRVPH
jgi:hypothetical protein